MSKISGLVCMVTGGASGLGKATVENFVRKGCKVVICDLPDSKGHELASELGLNAIFHPTGYLIFITYILLTLIT